MKVLLLFLSLFFCLENFGQFQHTFTSFPDSAIVYMNGEEKCVTPCRVKYYWKDRVNEKIEFKIEKSGYKDFVETLTEKPNRFDYYERINLNKDFDVFDLEGTPLIAFDKLLVDFDNGQKIGERKFLRGPTEEITWSGSIKVGDNSFEKKFYRIATDMGFNTLVSKGSQLFSEEDYSDNKLPKYIIGVEVVDYNISYRESAAKDYNDGEFVGVTTISFNWKVLNKKSNNIILEKQNTASFRFRQNRYESAQNNLEVFELALIDFLKSEELIRLVREDKSDFEAYKVDVDVKETKLPSIDLPEFASSSEMIQHVNPSCVTVITDGGHGSGVIISEKGLMLSAYHVVEGVNKIDVKFSSGLTLSADIVSYDKFNDIVLLDIQGEGFKALPLYSLADYPLGMDVLTIGTPADLDLGQSISKGIISGKRKNEGHTYLQVDMSISPGNSGGPLLNKDGQIVGIVQRKIIGTGIEGIGFAIPIELVKESLSISIK